MSLEKTITTKEEVKKKKKRLHINQEEYSFAAYIPVFQTQLHEHTTTVNAS